MIFPSQSRRIRAHGAIVFFFGCLSLTSCEKDPSRTSDAGSEDIGNISSSNPNISLAEDETNLIDNLLWTTVEENRDPLAELRPTSPVCPKGTWYEEAGSLEVQTGYCTYLALEQPALFAVNAGDELHVILWHADLGAPEPTEGYAALVVGERIIWEKTVPIPSDAKVYDEKWTAKEPIHKGDRVHLHIQNHGYNTWNLLSLSFKSP